MIAVWLGRAGRLGSERGTRLLAKDPWGNPRALFTLSGSLDRRDFGLRWNQALEAGGVLVGERVELELEVQAVKAAATKAA
jgi:hypothetical protein